MTDTERIEKLEELVREQSGLILRLAGSLQRTTKILSGVTGLVNDIAQILEDKGFIDD